MSQDKLGSQGASPGQSPGSTEDGGSVHADNHTPLAVPATLRPILFSGPMVKAILEGKKTQTRRVIKPQPTICPVNPMYLDWVEGGDVISVSPDATMALYCPYGRVGDLLWVREAFMRYPCDCGDCQGCRNGVIYRANYPDRNSSLWKPSIHMPKWAARIWLEITGVRVERLQEIGPLNAADEGVGMWNPDDYPNGYEKYPSVEAFRELWDSINGKTYPWASNPWVWVIEFKPATALKNESPEGNPECVFPAREGRRR